MTRVEAAGLLGSRSVREASCEFHALCDGLAAVELRGRMTSGEETRIWRDALLPSSLASPLRPGQLVAV